MKENILTIEQLKTIIKDLTDPNNDILPEGYRLSIPLPAKSTTEDSKTVTFEIRIFTDSKSKKVWVYTGKEIDENKIIKHVTYMVDFKRCPQCVKEQSDCTCIGEYMIRLLPLHDNAHL